MQVWNENAILPYSIGHVGAYNINDVAVFSPSNITVASLSSTSSGSQAPILTATPSSTTSPVLTSSLTIPQTTQASRPVLVPTSAVQPNGEVAKGFVPVSLSCDPVHSSAAAATKPSHD